MVNAAVGYKFIFKQYDDSLRKYDNNKYEMRKRAKNILDNHNIKFVQL